MKTNSRIIFFVLIGFLAGQMIGDFFRNDRINITSTIALLLIFIWLYLEKPFSKEKEN